MPLALSFRSLRRDCSHKAERAGERDRQRSVAVGDFLERKGVEHRRLVNRLAGRGRLGQSQFPGALKERFGKRATLFGGARSWPGLAGSEPARGGLSQGLVLCKRKRNHGPTRILIVR